MENILNIPKAKKKKVIDKLFDQVLGYLHGSGCYQI